MCGIIAYLGFRQALPILLAGLKRLEYRGYDSAGVGLICGDDKAGSTLRVVKKTGKVAVLEAATAEMGLQATLGIGHTRWATHGPPSDANAHPHIDGSNTVAVVHNGIIENYVALKTALQAQGVVFRSETDTELLAHLVADVRRKHSSMPLDAVVRLALAPVEGAFGVCFVFADRPDLLIGARHGSPLLVGVGEGEFFLASDASAVIEHTKSVEYLGEREMVSITAGGYVISSLDVSSPVVRDPQLIQLEMSLEAIEKGGYKHFMLKEIMEQPRALADAMRGRVNAEAGTLTLGGLAGEPLKKLVAASRIIIAACGTSFHSGLVGEYMIESLARVPVEVEYASEFRYRRPILRADEDVLVVISQSGETADTLAAVREARENGVMTIGLVNVVGSSIARETDAGCYLHVGPEIGVASTKAFTGQVLLLAMIALTLARERGQMSDADMKKHVSALAAIPEQMARVLSIASAPALELARGFRYASSFLYLGRGYNFPVALEGALKLKEVSYIHAEGYAAAEMKHGPIALIDKFMPVVLIAPRRDHVYEKIRSNLEEILTRGASVIAITEEDNDELDARCEAVLKIPATEEWLSPLLTVVPLQLLAYHIADLRKCNVDMPRNLAKSVTVE